MDLISRDSTNFTFLTVCPSVMLSPVILPRMERPGLITLSHTTRGLLSMPPHRGQRSVKLFSLLTSIDRSTNTERAETTRIKPFIFSWKPTLTETGEGSLKESGSESSVCTMLLWTREIRLPAKHFNICFTRFSRCASQQSQLTLILWSQQSVSSSLFWMFYFPPYINSQMQRV